MDIMALLSDPAAWLALLTLVALEVVLGIDNLIFIAILSNRLPAHQQEKARKVGGKVPLGRIGHPDDIAGVTLYLCSRAGRYVTGAILPIDGGQSVQHGVELFGT